eukprot:gene5832-1039_t
MTHIEPVGQSGHISVPIRQLRLVRNDQPGSGDPLPAPAPAELPWAVRDQEYTLAHPLVAEQRSRVKAAFARAWGGYTRYAFGHDELSPLTNATNDSWGGFGITLVDSLDTLILMGMQEEFQQALSHVARINYNVDVRVSFFETTIRHLGYPIFLPLVAVSKGLLSAYELSQEPILLQKALELGECLLPAFNSSSGIAYQSINLLTKEGGVPSWSGHSSLLAEAGSVQLEFRYLSYVSGDMRFWKAAQAHLVLSGGWYSLDA